MRTRSGLRIAYLAGPTDAEKTYAEWVEKQRPSSFDISYLRQFYQVCSELGAEAHVITTLPGRYTLSRFGNFAIENRPEPTSKGIFYHFAMAHWFMSVLIALFRYRPDVVVATVFQSFWFWLAPLRWCGVVIVAAIHCALWPRFSSLSCRWQFVMRLNRIFFYENVDTFLAVAPEVSDQICTFIRNKVEVLVFFPLFLRDYFISIPPPNRTKEPFRIMFSGRIEHNKGVYVVTDIAERLERNRKGKFKFEICGDGPQLAKLRDYIYKHELESVVSLHGYCNPDKLRTVLAQVNVVIVPTTTSFEEGFPKVCAEAILAGRPVIASAVCCGLARIREAVIEVTPDDVDAYYRAILQLSDDQNLYEAKCKACESLQAQFYDARNSYGAKLRAVLVRVDKFDPVTSRGDE